MTTPAAVVAHSEQEPARRHPMTKGIATKAKDLHKGDAVMFMGLRHNVIAAIDEGIGNGITLRLQVPGSPVKTFHRTDPGFTFTRIAR
jgi:hypothetical protein